MMSKRPYNFGPGPTILPDEVLLEAQSEWFSYQGSGSSILEISHRSEAFLSLFSELKIRLRQALTIPDNYEVLLVGGGARQHFSIVPLNFLHKHADYYVTGVWSELASQEAQFYGSVNLAAQGQVDTLSLPTAHQISTDADYFYYTPNETITGISVADVSQMTSQPIVADMTSCLFAQTVDISQYSLIFAGCQKNLGPAGLTIVIIDKGFLAQAKKNVAPMLSYQYISQADSLHATPPIFNCYMSNLMLQWLENVGGVEKKSQENKQKSKLLYDYLDNNRFYIPLVKDEKARSMLNISFQLKDPSLNDKFTQVAAKVGLVGIKGHRKLNGLRVSIYNTVTLEAVNALIQFMQQFAAQP